MNVLAVPKSQSRVVVPDKVNSEGGVDTYHGNGYLSHATLKYPIFFGIPIVGDVKFKTIVAVGVRIRMIVQATRIEWKGKNIEGNGMPVCGFA